MPPVMLVKASAGRHEIWDGFEDLKVSLIHRLKSYPENNVKGVNKAGGQFLGPLDCKVFV